MLPADVITLNRIKGRQASLKAHVANVRSQQEKPGFSVQLEVQAGGSVKKPVFCSMYVRQNKVKLFKAIFQDG